jgi:hypothetical protein
MAVAARCGRATERAAQGAHCRASRTAQEGPAVRSEIRTPSIIFFYAVVIMIMIMIRIRIIIIINITSSRSSSPTP